MRTESPLGSTTTEDQPELLKDMQGTNEDLSRQHKKTLLFIFKCIVSVCLIAWLFYTSDTSVYLNLLKNSSPSLLTFAILLTAIAVVFSAYRWQLLVVAQGHSIPLRSLVSSYFVGLFFNNFMPTSIGGDLVRIYDLKKLTRSGADAAASVVAERILAAFTLALIVAAGIAIGPSYLSQYKLIILLFSLACCCALLFILFADRLSVVMTRYESRLIEGLCKTASSLRSCTSSPLVVSKVLIYSLVFQIMLIGVNILIIKAMGLQVPVSLVLIAIPIISAVTMLPVSMNGLGIREASYIFFFSYAGLMKEEAVAVSIYFFLIVTFVSLIGGVIFATRK